MDPVVVPIKADVSELAAARAALQGLREDSQRAAAGGAPGGGPSAAANPSQQSSAGVLRELQALEGGLRGVTTSLRTLQGVIDALVARPAASPAPLVMPPGGDGGGGGGVPGATPGTSTPPNPNPPTPSSPRALPYDTQRMLQSLFVGAAGTMGLSLGVGAAFGEVSRGISTTEELAMQAALATMAAGGGPGDYRALHTGMLNPRFSTSVLPSEVSGIMRPMAAHGLPSESLPTMGYLLGEAGIRAYGSAPAGGQLGEQAYAALRTPEIGRYLATLVMQGERQGVSGAELIRQFQGLSQLLGGRQGAYARTPADMVELANLQMMLARVPGGAGAGQGGESIAQGLSEFGRGGVIENSIAIKAYQRATGRRPPITPDERIDFEEWSQSPAAWRAQAEMAREEFGPKMGGYLLSGKGRHSIKAFRHLMDTPGALTDDVIASLVSDDEAGGYYGAGNRGLDGTVGMRELQVRRDLERARGNQEGMATGQQGVRGWMADNYGAGILADLGGGLAMGAGGLGGWRLLRRLFGAGGAAAAARGGAAAGGTTAAGATAAGGGALPFLLRSLGVAGGGLSFLKDLYDVNTGEDPTNALDLILGLSGGMIGGLAGIPAGPLGIAGGALTGYGLGKGVAGGLDLINQSLSGDGRGGETSDLIRSLQFTHLPGGRVDLRSPGFRTAEQAYGLPPGILSALAEQESSGRIMARPYGKSAGGAQQYDAEGRPLQSSALGLFQFINSTGREMGLVGDGFDMRGDPAASTDAAARNLRNNYARYGSWGGALGAHLGSDDPQRNAAYGREVMARVAKYSDGAIGDGGQLPAPELAVPVGTEGGAGDGLHVFIHLDPNFPGTVSIQTPPGVTARMVN